MGTSQSSQSSRTRESLDEICQRVARNDPSLTKLHLAGYNIDDKLGDEGCKTLAKALESNTAVKELVLCSNSIGPVGASAIFQSLVNGTCVETLNLRDNKVGSGKKADNALTLAGKIRLKKLVLTDNDIDASGAAALAKSLTQNSSLEILYLSNNPIGNGGACALGETLKSTVAALKCIYLSSCQIGNEGMKGLAGGIQNNTTVRELGLVGNCIGDEGAKVLAKKLKNNQELEELWLTGNPISQDGFVSLIREGLQHNFSLKHIFLYGIEDPCLQQEKLFYLKLNRAGRQLLRKENLPQSLWAHVLGKIKREPDMIFYFLRANPQLVKRRA